MNQRNLVGSILILGGLLACQRYVSPENSIAKISADKPLEARSGEKVRWTFRAEVDGREIPVVDISASRLPFGLRPTIEAGRPEIQGTIDGLQFRNGLITVIAFDEKACRLRLEDTAKFVLQNNTDKTNQNVAIPFKQCDPRKLEGIPLEGENFYYGKFVWQIVDGPDEMPMADYKEFFKSVVCLDRSDCPKGLFQNLQLNPAFYAKNARQKPTEKDSLFEILIPQFEAPSTGLVLLGECARYPRQQCGVKTDCLWSGRACISAKTAGLSEWKAGG